MKKDDSQAESGSFEATMPAEPDMAAEPKKDSKKPKKKTAVQEMKTDLESNEIEELIVSLTNRGHSASEIGMILRDQHQIPKSKMVIGKRFRRCWNPTS